MFTILSFFNLCCSFVTHFHFNREDNLAPATEVPADANSGNLIITTAENNWGEMVMQGMC